MGPAVSHVSAAGELTLSASVTVASVLVLPAKLHVLHELTFPIDAGHLDGRRTRLGARETSDRIMLTVLLSEAPLNQRVSNDLIPNHKHPRK